MSSAAAAASLPHIRQTPNPIELVSMCPGMDLVAVSFTSTNNNNNSSSNDSSSSSSSSVYIFRTRPETQMGATDEGEEDDKNDSNQNNNNNNNTNEDAAAADNKNPTSSSSSHQHFNMLNTPPIYAYTIKSSSSSSENNNSSSTQHQKITSLQWAPAGGRLLAISTKTQIHIVHVELQALLRVHNVNSEDLLWSQNNDNDDSANKNNNNSSSILSTTWTRLSLQNLIGSPFPCSKILACENCGIPSSSSALSDDDVNNNNSTSSFSPQLLELAESEWSNGLASVMFVVLSDGTMLILLGGLMRIGVLKGGKLPIASPSSSPSSSPSLYIGNFHQSNPQSYHALLSLSSSNGENNSNSNNILELFSSSSSSNNNIISLLSSTILNSISIHSRLICQSRELLLKVRSDLKDAHTHWLKSVDKIIEKAIPAVLWRNRFEIMSSMVNGQMVRRLMERKELDQSAIVAAGEMLRDTSSTIMKSIVDVVFECVGVVSDHASVIQLNSSRCSSSSSSSSESIPNLVAALRDEVSAWTKQVSLERELLACVLRWLHHFIGSVRAAVIFEEELALRNDPNGNANPPPPSPPPAVSHIEPNDNLVAFDFFMMSSNNNDADDSDDDETTRTEEQKCSMPIQLRSRLLYSAKSIQDKAQSLLDQLMIAATSNNNIKQQTTLSSSSTSWNKPQPMSLQSLTKMATSCTAFSSSHQAHQQVLIQHVVQAEMGMMMVSLSNDETSSQPRCVSLGEVLTSSEENNNSNNNAVIICDYQPQDDCLELFVPVVGHDETNSNTQEDGAVATVPTSEDNGKQKSSSDNKSGKIFYVQRSRFEEFNQKKNHGAPSSSAKFATEFSPSTSATTSTTATSIIRLFPNAQRDTLAVVKGKRIQFLDITIEEDFDDDDNDDDDDADSLSDDPNL